MAAVGADDLDERDTGNHLKWGLLSMTCCVIKNGAVYNDKEAIQAVVCSSTHYESQDGCLTYHRRPTFH